MNLSRKFYLLFNFILLTFVIVLKIHSMQEYKKELNEEDIDLHIEKILRSEEENKKYLCHIFMNYIIKSDPPSLNREKVILKLREILKDEKFLDILDDANINYRHKIHNTMSHIEILNSQRTPINAIGDGIDCLVGYVSLNDKASGSGVLIPIPFPYQSPTHVKWYVLTSAHMIEALPRKDNKTYSVTITTTTTTQKKDAYPIRNLKIFKRVGRGVQITTFSPKQTERINRMSLIDMRATLNYDPHGDVALCELNIKEEDHKKISEKILGENSSSPAWKNKVLTFTLKNGKKCFFHFVSGNDDVSRLIDLANSNNDSIITRNFVLGWSYVNLNYELLQINERPNNLKLYKPGTFVHMPNINAENRYVFSYEAPGIPGMSGSPILFEDKNRNFHFYGLVRGGGSGGESEGVLLQYRLFLQDDGSIGDDF